MAYNDQPNGCCGDSELHKAHEAHTKAGVERSQADAYQRGMAEGARQVLERLAVTFKENAADCEAQLKRLAEGNPAGAVMLMLRKEADTWAAAREAVARIEKEATS